MEPTSTPNSTSIDKPVQVHEAIGMDKAKDTGKLLGEFVKSNNLSANIAGKNFIMVEGWQFVGAQLGLTDVVISCDEVTDPSTIGEAKKETKYRAVVEIVNQQGTVVSRGFAWCSNNESKKKSFDEYAIASMAQTRAIGKAYRNILSWIVKMAGYEATPAEEIDRDSMEADLTKAKQDVLKALNEAGKIKGTEIMEYINKIIGKNVIETVDEAKSIIRSLDDE